MTNVPEIRFQGFTDAWEQQKLGDVAEFFKGNGGSQQTKLGTFFRTLDNTIAIYKRKLDSLQELKKAYLQVMFPQVGETIPKIRFSGFIKNWEIIELGDVFEQTVRNVNPKEHDLGAVDNYFSVWLKSHMAITLYKTYATGGLIEKQHVQFPTLTQIKVAVPSFAEQAIIGNLFGSIDKQIIYIQLKIEKLKELKEVYMQKMFV